MTAKESKNKDLYILLNWQGICVWW